MKDNVIVVKEKGFIYRLYPENETTVLLTLEKEGEDMEKEVGIYNFQENTIIKKVQDKNFFKKHQGFGIGKFWVDYLKPKKIVFWYLRRQYVVMEKDFSKAVIVKYEGHEKQLVFPKGLCSKC